MKDRQAYSCLGPIAIHLESRDSCALGYISPYVCLNEISSTIIWTFVSTMSWNAFFTIIFFISCFVLSASCLRVLLVKGSSNDHTSDLGSTGSNLI